MTPGADAGTPGADARATWSALADLYQGVIRTVVDRLEREAGIDSGTFSALAYLERADPPGRLPLGELQRLLAVRYSQPGLSRLVQRMESDGLVSRRPSDHDRRASVVVVTRQGRARHRAAASVYEAAIAAEFGRHLGPGEADRLRMLLAKVERSRSAARAEPARRAPGARGARRPR